MSVADVVGEVVQVIAYEALDDGRVDAAEGDIAFIGQRLDGCIEFDDGFLFKVDFPY